MNIMRFLSLVAMSGPSQLKIQGGELAHDGLEFLRKLDPMQKTPFRGTAAIIGGGNTAIDVARSLARLGVTPLILYRRRMEDMPAFEPEIAMAVKEGVKMMELVAPIRIQKNTGDASISHPAYTLTLQQMKISKEKIAGRPWVVPDGEKTKTVDVHDIYVAIGAKADAIWHSIEA